MTISFYNIPSDGYRVADYIGDIPFEQSRKDKAVRTRIFHLFLQELPVRLAELRKIVPHGIHLDYSYTSLQKLDSWLNELLNQFRLDFFDETRYQKQHHEIANGQYPDKTMYFMDIQSRFVVPAVLRSLSTDLSIYLCEALRRSGMDDLVWIEGHSKTKIAGGVHPRAYSKSYGNCLESCVDDGWASSFIIFMEFVRFIAHPDGKPFNRLQNNFTMAHDLNWNDPVPDHLLFPKF